MNRDWRGPEQPEVVSPAPGNGAASDLSYSCERGVAREEFETAQVRRLTEQYCVLRDDLLAISGRVVRDREVAEDVQDVFVRLLERFRDGRGVDPNVRPAYLRTAVRQSSLDGRRNRAKRDDPGWRTAVADESMAVPTPFEVFLSNRRTEVVEEIQEELPPGQRTVFELVDRKGLTYAAAAEQMATSKENVKRQLSRARQRFRKGMESRGWSFADHI